MSNQKIIYISNKKKIEKAISKLEGNYKLGIYHDEVDKLSEKDLNEVIFYIGEGWADVNVTIDNVPHVVEIATVDSEIDVMTKTKKEHSALYSREWRTVVTEKQGNHLDEIYPLTELN